jgi:catechol 2,3-dioxygenase-like lactoylglutathione lyase family enzyme
MSIGVSRVFHLNVNCSDLERSLAFYRDRLGLTQGAHTVPDEPQPGAAFGLDAAQWDAWILNDRRGFGVGTVLDLLEWQVPRPAGAPYPAANHLGFGRLGFACDDVDGLYGRLVAAGVDCTGAPHDIGLAGAPPVRAFVCADPDGTLLEFVTAPPGREGNQLSFVAINCSNLERSLEFYVDVLGCSTKHRFAPGPSDGSALRLGPEVEWEMAYLDDPSGSGTFALDLVEWKSPRSDGPPYTTANHLGIYRMAFFTDDIDRDFEGLRRAGVECVTPPAHLEMGPGIPSLRALLFPDPDGTMLELIESPNT